MISDQKESKSSGRLTVVPYAAAGPRVGGMVCPSSSGAQGRELRHTARQNMVRSPLDAVK
jgi:hypothetical protein